MLVIMGTASIVGFITFLIGYVGPIIFTPENNLGPLLGIFITGPLGFLLGGVIGFWRLLRVPTRKISAVEWGALLGIWLLSMGWYLMFSLFGPKAILFVTILQVVTVIGTSTLYLQRSIKLQQPNSNYLHFAIFAALLIIATEVFPPVTHPNWDRPYDGYLKNPPPAAFYWDPRMDTSRRVPQLAIDKIRLVQLWVLVVSVNGVAWFVLRPSKLQDTDGN